VLYANAPERLATRCPDTRHHCIR